MKKLFLALVIFLFLLNKLFAEVVNSININGNNRISSETIKIYGNIEINKNYNEVDLNNILTNLYATEFFEDVKVSIINNELKISVKEFPFVDQIIISGEKSNKFKEQIKKLIKTKEKRSFVKSNLLKDIEMIKKIYSLSGYNSSKVEIGLISV